MRTRWTILGLGLAACGGEGEGAVVEGTFAPGLAPTTVWVAESERSERADTAGFRVEKLTPGPASLRLLSGDDTAAVLNLSGLGDGAVVRLEGLRVDRQSGYAFPREVRLQGAEVVMVNGLRMAPAGRVPREVDVHGAVLAWSPNTGALLLRPDNARMPDLRVVVGMATEVVGEDGGGADADGLQPGDSVRVEGRSDQGYVVATRLTLPTRIAGTDAPGDEDGESRPVASRRDEAGGGGGGDSGDDGGGGVESRPAPIVAPVVRRGGNDGPGRGRGRGRDDKPERGKGGGNGKGKGRG